MKILRIQGRNLASLATFDCNLADGPLGHAGLFAITGPTGAGKSTLLDALCLALFGKTPRLSDRGGAEIGGVDDDHRLAANDVRNLVQRGATGAEAVVIFLGQDNRPYAAHWSVARARNKATGALQKQKRWVTDLESGKVLAGGKIAEVDAAIADKLGLNFDQFKRSALLAQGDFATFLRAKPDERSELLEKVTGTQIYSEISKLAHQRAAEANKAIELAETQLGGTTLLSDAEREGLQAEIAAGQEGLKAAQQEVSELEAAERWFMALADRRKAEAEAESVVAEAQKAVAAIADQEAQLAQVQAAQALRTPITNCDRLAREQTTTATAIASQEVALQTANEALKQAQDTRQAANERKSLIAKIQDDAQASLNQARRLDTQVAEQHERVAAIAPAVEMAIATLGAPFETLDAARLAQTRYAAQQADAQQRQEATEAAVAQLPLATLRVQREALTIRQDHVRALHNLAEQAKQQREGLDQHRAALSHQEELLTAAANDLEEAKILAIQAEARLEEAQSTQTRLQATRELAGHRTDLVPGEPCPLCGATEHPAANREEGVVEQELADLKKRIKALSGEKSAADTRRGQAESAQQTAEATIATIQQSLSAGSKALAGLAATWHEAVATAANAPAAAVTGLLPYASDRPDPTPVLSLCWPIDWGTETAEAPPETASATLETYMVTTQAAFEALARQEALADEQRQAMDQARKQLEQSQAEVAAAKTLLDHAERADRLAGLEAGRQAALASLAPLLESLSIGPGPAQPSRHLTPTSVATIEKALKSATQQVETAWLDAQQVITDATAAVASATNRLADLKQALKNLDNQQGDAQNQLVAALAAAGLDEAIARTLLVYTPDWIAAQFQAIATTHKALHTAVATRDERRHQREQHEATPQPPLATDPLSEHLTLAREAATSAQTALNTLTFRLQNDDMARQVLADQRLRIDQMRADARVWNQLDDLIGSASGKKFRLFAQSLTLSALLDLANHHLADLRPRYALAKVPGEELDIQVIDRDMGDEVRSANSLSGGETFLVSLALALALSSFSSHSQRIRSLFIDEGFGTLDATTLEDAIAALDALQAQGRQVGIISHVPGLGERLGIQVRITPQGGGKSTMQVVSN